MRQRAILKVKYPDVFREIALEISDDMQCAKPMSRDLAERIRRLVNGVSADPDEPVGDESLLSRSADISLCAKRCLSVGGIFRTLPRAPHDRTDLKVGSHGETRRETRARESPRRTKAELRVRISLRPNQ